MTYRILARSLVALAALMLIASPGEAAPGNSERGKAFFVGMFEFSSDGPPCLGCHGVAGNELGLAAGASYGPDLSAFHENYGKEGVVAVLQDLTMFESMQAVYAERPLTEAEIDDLAAFFATVSRDSAPAIRSELVLHVGIGTVLLVVLLGFFGWRRLRGVRRPLLDRSGHGKES